jgi:hypothetical protein
MSDDKARDPKEIRKLIGQHTNTYALMGHLASDWAMLEFMINETIWKLAGVPAVTGACITAHIFTMNNRLMALASLMRLRGFDEEMIKEVNRFAEAVRAPGEKRNRTIHDPVLVNVSDQSIGRLEITAQRKPVFEVVPISAEEINKIRLDILRCSNQFLTLRSRLLEKLRTLPDIPNSQSLPLDLTLMVERVDDAKGK